MPPKGKGMTMNQKRERLLRIFHEKKEIYSYPQIEKEGEKAGINIFQKGRDTIKEVLESLVSDTLVDVDSLGTSKCYWSLPSQAYLRLKSRNEEVLKSLQQNIEKKEDLQKQIDALQTGREITEERKQVEKQLQVFQSIYEKKVEELEIYRRFDPERVQQLKKETKLLQDQLIQWNDDICQLTYYLKNQAGMTNQNLEQLGLPFADLD